MMPRSKLHDTGGVKKRGGKTCTPSRPKSATPGAQGLAPRLILKLKTNGAPLIPPAAPSIPHIIEPTADNQDGAELPSVQAVSATGRPLRAKRAPHQPDMLYGDIHFPSSDIKSDDNQNIPSSPPPMFSTVPFAFSKISEAEPSSQTVALLTPASNVTTDISELTFSREVHLVYSRLLEKPYTALRLPPYLEHDTTVSYTAAALNELYLLCYRSGNINLCDLIIDTWIRTYQALRAQTSADQVWRLNTALQRRKLRAANRPSTRSRRDRLPGDDAPDYGLPETIQDPRIAQDVITKFHPQLINNLFTHTRANCGARLLWADALALGGDKTEDALLYARKSGAKVHKDFLYHLACTGLRMCRRHLTLKCEEDAEGEWCRRYHEHSRQGQPCYRESAGKEIKMDGYEGSAVDIREEDEFTSAMQLAFEGNLSEESEAE